MSGTILNIFAEIAAEKPDEPCALAADQSKTYAELDQASNSLAAHLQDKGIQSGDHVGISLDRTVDMLVALFAVWKAGACYVPIDPTYPQNRIRHMVEDSGAKLVLTQTMIDTSVFGSDANLFLIDRDWDPTRGERPSLEVSPGDLAYTIYTSGSTGKPKGVQVMHGNVVNFLKSMQHTPGLTPDDKLLAVTTLSFDIAVLELYLPVITGALVEIVSRELASDGRALAEKLDKGDITVLQATPSTWRMLLDAGWKGRTGLKALVGGEALPKDIVPGLLERVDELWNMYGPTETTVWSTCFRVENADAPILIGKPIDNTTVYVVDEKCREVPVGQSGELLIGGDGVTRGYYNRQELTKDRFIADALGDSNGRLYRTGDLVKMLPDGNLQYINRLDNQIKLRGFRIELGEIETTVSGHEAVSQCVVVLRDDKSGQPRLVAYIKNDGIRTTTAGELRAYVLRDLPEFMTPSVWMFVDKMPLTPNGKIDRNALPEPSTDRPELGQAYIPPRTPLEKYLAKIWRKSLGLDKIGTRDRFFDLGGNSIKAIQFVDQLGNHIGQKISMPGFFGAPCIAEFAELLERDHADGVDKLLGRSKEDRKQSNMETSGAEVQHRRGGMFEDLAIVGMATRLPGAANTAQFWNNLRDGIESRHEVTAEDLIAAGLDPVILQDPTYVPACMPLDDVDKFDAAFFGINPREAQMMDPQHRIFLECCWTAMEDAGYPPDRSPKSIGVFAGIARNAYHLHNISSIEEYRVNAHDYSILLGNDKDFLATRVSYKLNLRGPSMTVLTACSGSGTALHQARLALLNGDCDMALVGGGRVMSPHKVGYHYVDGNVLSADGHVHAFDQSASGMVRGSGMAAILVKRLSDAIDDGDDIKAVIKTTAINNDGASKASFTAPSVPGQVIAIRQALADADVTPDSISYVEAHGTGTRLGDPIEVAALSEAWSERKNGNQYCPIGSSKTNVGHLDAGACIAGIIKTALSMRHGQIPPSLNYDNPNPLIDLENSPFYVNTELAEWHPNDYPRRAAVSSFGVGGSNVHVLMEEAPERQESSSSRPRQLLLLSAKRSEAIGIQAEELATVINEDDSISLPDMAYTLQTGRSDLPLRWPIVCEDREDAIAKLRKLARKGTTPKPAEDGVPVVFMFPGQGSQHVNMARELYDHEAVYRVHFEHCSRSLKPLLGMDLRSLVYPDDGADIDKLAEQLKQTEIAQLALFAVEYSIAKVWMSWGISPVSMIGHSIGEFVAACLADVIELHDCLRILHSRASLMGSMPPGDMLAVALSVTDLGGHLTEGISIAASNAPEITVASGQSDLISEFQKLLEGLDIQTFPLHTSHAFHSEMMEPILEPFVDSFEGIALNAPKIPFVSSMSGTWITDEQATSPDYWADQLRNGVLFSNGISTILEEDDPVFLEVGPSTALSNSVRKHASAERPLRIVSTLSSAHKPDPALETTLNAFGALWAAGVAPDWNSFYASEMRQRVTLPTYPFARDRHWIEPALGWAGEASADKADYDALMLKRFGDKESEAASSVDIEPMDHLGRTRERLKAMLFDVTGIEIDSAEEDMSFLDLGFDSLLLTQISGRLTKEFGISLRFWELIEQYSSVESLAPYLADHIEDEEPNNANGELSTDTEPLVYEAQPATVSNPQDAAQQPNDELVALVERQALTINAISEKLRRASGVDKNTGASTHALIPTHDDRDSGVEMNVAVADPSLETTISMTPSQLEILATASESDLASCCYNNVIRIAVSGKLDMLALSRAAELLVARHQSLRAVFHAHTKSMCVAKKMPLEVGFHEIADTDEHSRRNEVRALAQDEAKEPFDIVKGPLIRLQVVKSSDRVFDILMATHQLAVDNWSIDLLADEFAELYSSIIERRESKLPPASTYLQYAEWLNDPKTRKRRSENYAYWLEKYRLPVASIALKGSKGHPSSRGYAATRAEQVLGDQLADSVATAAAAEKSTFFAFTLACYVALLCRLSGGGPIRVGIPAAGQLDIGENRLAGSCINTLPLTFQVKTDMTFRECLHLVRQELYSAQSYTPFTYTEIVTQLEGLEGAGRLPLIAAMFNVDQEDHTLEFSELKAHYTIVGRPAEKFEIAMNVVSHSGPSYAQCYFNDDVFSQSDRDQFVGSYLALLEEFVGNPETKVSEAHTEIGDLVREETNGYVNEPQLQEKFLTLHSSSGLDLLNWADPELYASRQVEAVTQEFNLSLPAGLERKPNAATEIPSNQTGIVKVKLGSHQKQEALYFGENDELYGIYRPVESAGTGGVAVLLCSPHGDESVRSHRLIRSLSTELQKAGIPSLRFDYFGEGDSAGNDSEATLALWCENVLAAKKELARLSGCTDIRGVGIRIGANLLLELGHAGKMNNLILVDALRNGQAELEKWRHKNRWMLRDNGRYRFGRIRRRRQDNIEELAGYCYNSEMLQQIESISIDTLSLPQALMAESVGLGNSNWSSGLDIPTKSVGDDPEWNNPAFMQKPILNSKLVQYVCTKFGDVL